MMRFLLFSSAALVFVVALLGSATAQDSLNQGPTATAGLRVEIKTNKAVYHVGEAVLFTAVLRNEGIASAYISKDFSEAGGGIAGFYVEVKQLTGKPSSKKCAAAGDRSPMESRMPEQVLHEDYLLLPPGAMVGFQAPFFTGCVVRNPGIYRAQVVYSAQDMNVNRVKQVAAKPDEIVTGQFYSAPSKFRVR
jgi:hypothetical protein